jgi:nucleoside-diphosphate-sugar epimerase
LINALNLSGSTVLVTGASGFIGGRLVDYLFYHYNAKILALTRNYGRSVLLARLPVKLVPGDLLDPESLQKAAADCDAIFHCAAGMSGDDDVRYRTTVEGTRNILDAALANKVKLFLYVSSIAVHGPNPGSVIDENTPLTYCNDIYTDAKIDAEKLVSQYGNEKGLPIVIVRPTVVYGPRSNSWTVGPINNMKNNRLTLIDGGSGIANHVYIDDVVQGMLLAAKCPEAIGEVFILSYGNGATWKEFFSYYTLLLGIDLPDISVETINHQRQQIDQLRNPINKGLSFLASPHARSVAYEIPGAKTVLKLAEKTLPNQWKQSILSRANRMREIKLNPPILPRNMLVEMFCAKGICKIDKAQNILGYHPEFSLDEGMKLTEAWLRHVRLV